MKDHEIQHITSFREHFSTYVSLVILTIMTVAVSVFGADLLSLTVLTAMAIATVKAIVVGYYFMHLKYEAMLYQIMVGVVMLLFIVFMFLTVFDYIFR